MLWSLSISAHSLAVAGMDSEVNLSPRTCAMAKRFSCLLSQLALSISCEVAERWMAKISARSFDIFLELSAGGGVISPTASTTAGETKMGVLGAFAGTWPKADAAR